MKKKRQRTRQNRRTANQLRSSSNGAPLAPAQTVQGKITSDSGAELRFSMGVSEGRVALVFGQRVGWVGFAPDEAINVGRHLIELAGEAKGRKITCRIGYEE